MRFKHFLAGLGALLLFSCENSSDFKKTDSASQTYPETPASTFEHLKELNWLAGSWVEKDRDYVTSNVISWNATKTILTQYFSIKVGGKKKLEGQQIIAWDPAEKKMRSWIFDSDGGIGESVWSQQGDSWFADTLFTLPDGRKATAVHIYKKIDDKTYTFASENRDIHGRLLPNLGPFTFVRESR